LLRAIEADLRPLNTGHSSAWKKATNRDSGDLAINGEHGNAQEKKKKIMKMCHNVLLALFGAKP